MRIKKACLYIWNTVESGSFFAFMSTSQQAPASNTLPADKPRYEWIDNARIVAALLIIYVHMPWFFHGESHVNNALADNLVRATTYYGRVPYFLILAGYFLARRITWHKAFDRALWLLIPFVAWNVLYYLWLHMRFHTMDHIFVDFPSVVGFGALFTRDFGLFGLSADTPIISVSWFLRDIIILSLLTPLLYPCRRFLLILLVIICSFSESSVQPDTSVMLSPGTCFYYLLGVCLVDFRIADAYRILNKRFTPFLIVGFLGAVAICCYTILNGMQPLTATLVGGLFGALMIAHCGVLIETHLPRLSKWLAPCGPACFLVFMLHEPIFLMGAWLLPKWLTGSWVIWLIPIPVCAAIICLFLLMKRLAPWLLPYLGHMKMPKKAS